ncbi:hypothetical protein EDB86DRAFT_2828132 [Lactarius hatsudake]|nr:hypothetical protein EDB86DRAFT_2828132 [Lactarius hatsudake]
MDEWWRWGGDMGDKSDGSDKWARVGIGGGHSGRGVDGEGAGNKLGSESEQMDGGTRGEGKVLCDENTWGELDDAMIGQTQCSQTSFFWLLAVWQQMCVLKATSSDGAGGVWDANDRCEVGRANEVLVVRGSIEIDGRPWYDLRWVFKAVRSRSRTLRTALNSSEHLVWLQMQLVKVAGGGWAGKGMGGGGNGLGITLGSSRKWAGRGVGGEDVDGAGAGNELGSRGEQAGGGVRGEGKVICGESMWDELYGVTIGQVEFEELGIRT